MRIKHYMYIIRQATIKIKVVYSSCFKTFPLWKSCHYMYLLMERSDFDLELKNESSPGVCEDPSPGKR